MREDFDRLQNQLKKREEREKQAQDIAKFNLEERVMKANSFNLKGETALEKVKAKQRKLELQSIRSYKKDIKEMEERRNKALQEA